MSELIKLTVSTRNGEVPKPAPAVLFDIDDIVTPIRRAGPYSYFHSRMEKGTVAGASRSFPKVEYKVTQTLAAIQALSTNFLLLTVYKRREVSITNELVLFNISRISETITQVSLATDFGTKFFYCEDGDPLPVEYYVRETEDEILAQIASNSSGITTLDWDLDPLVDGDTKDLSGYSGELIINVSTSDPSATNAIGFINDSNVTKITLRPADTLDMTAEDQISSGGVFKLSAPILDIFGSSGGFLELTKRTAPVFVGAVWYQTNYIDQYST